MSRVSNRVGSAWQDPKPKSKTQRAPQAGFLDQSLKMKNKSEQFINHGAVSFRSPAGGKVLSRPNKNQYAKTRQMKFGVLSKTNKKQNSSHPSTKRTSTK